MKKITTLTMNPCVDVSAAIDRVEPVIKLRCTDQRRDPGGGGINVARAIHILGGQAAAYYTSGGVTGKLLQQMLNREDIENRPLKVSADTRESFAVRETETGDQYRFVLPGPRLQQEDWHRCIAELKKQQPRPDYFVASGSLPEGVEPDFYARLAAELDQSDTRFIVDTSGAPLQAVLAKGVYLVKPNLRELQQASGKILEDEKDQEEYCRELVDKGSCEIIILSLAHNGALLTDRERQIRLPAMKIEVESAIGAGDSFVAGVVYSLARGKSSEESFYYGMAAGTAALVTPGTELCRLEDTEKFYRRFREQQN